MYSENQLTLVFQEKNLSRVNSFILNYFYQHKRLTKKRCYRPILLFWYLLTHYGLKRLDVLTL